MESEVEFIWSQVKDTVNEVASLLQEKNRKLKKHWFNKACQDAIKNRNICRLYMLQDETTENIQPYKKQETQPSL